MFDSEFRKAGNYNKERATPILGLCQGAFIDQFIFFQIHCRASSSFQENGSSGRPVHKRIWSIRKRKVSVIKGSKIPFSGLTVDAAFWFVGRKHFLDSRQNRSKNKLVSENALTRVHGSCLLAPDYGLLQKPNGVFFFRVTSL